MAIYEASHGTPGKGKPEISGVSGIPGGPRYSDSDVDTLQALGKVKVERWTNPNAEPSDEPVVKPGRRLGLIRSGEDYEASNGE